uniref:Uncharacterized protein n=1 Tax=mine drainage metagenome TaxID=410659 RepID=E6QK89_9ZZZZ
MQKPVAMPTGGMMIFFTVTADRPSFTRHARIPINPNTVTTAVNASREIPPGNCMNRTLHLQHTDSRLSLVTPLVHHAGRLSQGHNFA